MNTESGEVYYFNAARGEVRWQRPTSSDNIAIPDDVDRASRLVGKSNWNDPDLKGMVRNLEIVNEGDRPEYVHF